MTIKEPIAEPPELPEEKPIEKKKRSWIKDLLRVLIIAGVFIVMALVFKEFDVQTVRDALNPDESVTGRLKSYTIFLLCASLLQAVGLPRWFVCVVAGGIYGAFVGILLAMSSSLLGAQGTYMVGRSMLRSVVKRRLKGKRVQKWKGLLEENPFMGTLYMRLFPGSNAVMTGLICGLCKIPRKPYWTANFIGFLPQTLIFCTFGSAAAKAKTEQIIMGIVIFIVILVAQWYAMKLLRARRKKDEALIGED